MTLLPAPELPAELNMPELEDPAPTIARFFGEAVSALIEEATFATPTPCFPSPFPPCSPSTTPIARVTPHP